MGPPGSSWHTPAPLVSILWLLSLLSASTFDPSGSSRGLCHAVSPASVLFADSVRAAGAARPYAPCGTPQSDSAFSTGPVGFQGPFQSLEKAFVVRGTLFVYDNCHVAIANFSYSGAEPGSLALCGGQPGSSLQELGGVISRGPVPLPGQSLVVLFTGRRGLTWDNIHELYLCSTAPGTGLGVPLVPQQGYASVALPQRGARLDVGSLQRMQALSASISAAASAQGTLASPPPPSPPPSPPQPPPPRAPSSSAVQAPSKGFRYCTAAVPGVFNFYWNIRAAPGQVLLSTHSRGSRGGNSSGINLENVLFQVEFGLEAKVGEDTWLALGIPANQSKPEMRNSDAVIAGVMSPSMLLAAAPSPPASAGAAAAPGVSTAGFATNFFITAQQPCVEEAGGYIGVCPDSLIGGSAQPSNVQLTLAARQGDVTFVRFLRNASSSDNLYDLNLFPSSAAAAAMTSSSARQPGNGSGKMWLLYATGPLAPGSSTQIPLPLFHDPQSGFRYGTVELDFTAALAAAADAISAAGGGGNASLLHTGALECESLWGTPAAQHPTLPPYMAPPPPGAPAAPPSDGSPAALATPQPFWPCRSLFQGRAESFSSCLVLPGGFFLFWTYSGSTMDALLVASSVLPVSPVPLASAASEANAAPPPPAPSPSGGVAASSGIVAFAAFGLAPVAWAGRKAAPAPTAPGSPSRAGRVPVPGASVIVASVTVQPVGNSSSLLGTGTGADMAPAGPVDIALVHLPAAPAGAAPPSEQPLRLQEFPFGQSKEQAQAVGEVGSLQVQSAQGEWRDGSLMIRFQITLSPVQAQGVPNSTLVWAKGTAPAPPSDSAAAAPAASPAAAISESSWQQELASMWAAPVDLSASTQANSSSASDSSPAQKSHPTLPVHATLAIAAWGFLLPLGALLARVLWRVQKAGSASDAAADDPNWLRRKLLAAAGGAPATLLALHRAMQTIGTALTLSAFATGLGLHSQQQAPQDSSDVVVGSWARGLLGSLVELASNGSSLNSSASATDDSILAPSSTDNGSSSSDAILISHLVLGSMITALAVTQVISGVWRPEADSLKGQGDEGASPGDSKSEPAGKGFRLMRGQTTWKVWRLLHSCGGGLSMVLAVCQVFLGLALSHAAAWIWALWGAWLALLLVTGLLLSLDSLPLASPSSTHPGGFQGIARWGRGGDKSRLRQQSPQESVAQADQPDEGGSSTDGHANGMSGRPRGGLAMWPLTRGSTQGDKAIQDGGLAGYGSLNSAAQRSSSGWGGGTGGWRSFWQHRLPKGGPAKEALADQAEIPGTPEAAGALGATEGGHQQEAASGEAVLVQVADCAPQASMPAWEGVRGTFTPQQPSSDGLGSCPQVSAQGQSSSGATQATSALLPSNLFTQPQYVEQHTGSTADSCGWQPVASEAIKPLAPLTEGKQVALPLLDPGTEPSGQVQEGPVRTPVSSVIAAEAQEHRAPWNSTSYAGVAAGVEGRVVVESREEANRRKFALIRQQIHVQVDKYNVKAVIRSDPSSTIQ